MALQSRNPPPGVIHHSDQGVQYAARDYVDTLHFHGFRISMARRGNPYDNAVAESFLKTLKTEEVYLWEYETLADVEKRVPYFIEEVYNRKRLHSSLSYRPPEEFERMFLTNNQSNPCLSLSYPVQTQGFTPNRPPTPLCKRGARGDFHAFAGGLPR